MKRLIALLLCFFLLSQSAINVKAAPTMDAATYNSLISQRLQELDEVNLVSSSGQFAIFNKLGRIVEYAIYLDFIFKNNERETPQDSLGMPVDLVTTYSSTWYQYCVEFNEKFSENSTQYTSLELGIATTTFSEYGVQQYIENTLNTVFSTYMNDYLNSVVANGGSKADMKSKYGSTLGVMCSMLEILRTDASRVASWTGNGFEATAAPLILATIDSLYANADYKLAFEVGEECKGISTESDLYADTTLTFIENLAETSFDEEGNLEVAADPSVSMSYLAFVAGSAVYVPLESYTGSSEFSAAIESLFDRDRVKDAKLLYNSTKSYKKPLYKRKLDSSGSPTGVATMITVEEFFDDILNGNTGALCTILGNFEKDSDVWLYTQSSKMSIDASGAIVPNYGESTSTYQLQNSTGGDTGDTDDDNDSDNGDPTAKLDSFMKKAGALFDRRVYAAVNDGFSENSNEPELGTSGGNSVYSAKKVTDESAMSAPILLYGAKYARKVDNMTTAILTNILKGSHNINSITNKDSRYLYVNVYGDIVLDNDLVILPGAANPLMYKSDEYNPFTAAFMNNYPSVLKNTSYFKLASKSDIGKYLVFGDYDAESSTVVDWLAVKTASIDTITPDAPLTFSSMQTSFTSNSGIDIIKVLKTRKLIFDAGNLDEDSKFYSYTPLLNSTAITVNGCNVFPYIPDEDEDYVVGNAIASNMFTHYAISDETGELKNQERLNDAYIIDALIINCMNGSDNATGFEDDMMLEYENYTENSTNRRMDTLEDVSSMIFDNTTSVSGVIGVKSVYDNALVGRILNIFHENWIIFYAIVIIILLIYFSKAKLDIFQCSMFAVVILFSAYLFVSVIPSFIPSVFNLVTNNLAQNLTYEILSLDAEHYSVEGAAEDLNENGEIDYKSTSTTLYKVTGGDREDFLNGLNVDSFDVVGGNTAIINKDAGVFAKDDTIRVNLNVLFDTLKITGDLNSSYAYTLSTKKTVSSNIDYYVPYYQIVDSLVDKINSISEIYSIPRKTITYANGEAKNNYLVYCYVNSKPFVTPGNYSYVIPSSELDWTEEEIRAYQEEGDAITTLLENTYGSNADWLGISNFLYNLDSASKKTLWAQTLRDLGYYDANWSVNVEKMDELVSYVNYQTKKFVYDISTQIGYMSDDIMIKVISLRALIALTQKASDLGHWMYPYTVNYDEMLLKDVLRSVFISDYDKYVDFDMDVVHYIMDEYGWFNLIVFDTLVILLFITASLINTLVPLSYMAIGILLLIKLITAGGIRNALKGYLKVSALLCICSTMMTGSILVARALNGNVISIYFLLLLTLLVLYILIFAILSVIRNFAEFGNTAINVNVSNKVHSLSNVGNTFKNHRSINTRNLVYQQEHARQPVNKSLRSRYSMNASVDDVYSQSNRIRSNSYYSGSERTDNSKYAQEVDDLTSLSRSNDEINEL